MKKYFITEDGRLTNGSFSLVMIAVYGFIIAYAFTGIFQ